MRTLFQISKSGLRNAEKSLSVTSNNIINADTPGYSRQRVENAPAGMQMSRFHAGLGVNITNVNRLRDEMNDTLLNEKKQDMGYLQKKKDVFEKLESAIVSDSGGGLDSKIGSLFNNFSEVSSNPQDISIRNNLISEAQQFTAKMSEVSRNIDRASDLVKDTAVQKVDSVNGLLKDLDQLNDAITKAQAQGKPDHSSLDIRTQKLGELSELIDFESQLTDTGALQIRVGGMKVLDENKAHTLKAEVNDVDKSFKLRMETGHIVKASGGELGGEIEMYEEEIPDMKRRLGTIASTMVEEFNALHQNGYGLEDSTARNFFTPGNKTAATISVNQALVDNPRHIAASTQAGVAGNGDMASQIAGLRNKRIVESNATRNSKLVNYTVELISQPGSKLNGLESSIAARDSEIQMLKNQQQEEAGVNIDEELSRMVKFQNAYQGAARVMSTAQDMYDTLISIAR
ncbi:flagellar hook-associated protein FlgK [Aliifodinibius sp. S!AR15-10]|uniref:flagellar hook-associated protein FlgK n=1 Tax=Aliifodinibius sp. S!AR15-10 TaxID=2950437 RepID=UPI002862606D|nr:flagellar hook-associated protein FlgK [Aliifodinibius sp. S!AR15-10]MDR8394643.1 flagellar hook-associated protein FlgK [Aliifodinibius sp. S!AR15-10]